MLLCATQPNRHAPADVVKVCWQTLPFILQHFSVSYKRQLCHFGCFIADLQQLLGDFEQDLEAAVPSQWQHLIVNAHEQQGHEGSSQAAESTLLARGKLRSRLLDLTSSSRSASLAAAGGAVSAGASAALPVVWAHKLDAVLAVLRLAVDEWGRAMDSMHSNSRRAELLESNVEEVGGHFWLI
jgi:hypothetical protein